MQKGASDGQKVVCREKAQVCLLFQDVCKLQFIPTRVTKRRRKCSPHAHIQNRHSDQDGHSLGNDLGCNGIPGSRLTLQRVGCP